jgi:2,5-furandicarboxylate decarboxylase 1
VPDQDLHHWLARYRADHPDDVLVLDEPISGDQVLSALAVELWSRAQAPVLVAPDVDGLGLPVVTNVFASRARVARLLGTDEPGLHAAFRAGISRPQPLAVVDDPAGLVADEHVDVRTIPMLSHFAQDAAPYITSGVIIAEDPETGIGNASYHRCMVSSPTALATSLHSRGHLWRYLRSAAERGTHLPVALVIGGHPLFLLACSARVGIDVDERELAGGLFGAPLEVVRTPEHGLAVPAWSDLVLEGTIDPEAFVEEGPFGEYSGYASARSTNTLLDVGTILRRPDPILLDIVSGREPDHLNLGRIPREAELVAKLQERFPDLVGIHYPASGTHFHCYLQLRSNAAPGAARQALVALLGFDPYVKLAVAVDDDIDLRRDDEVLWAIATRFQADRDLVQIERLPGSLLDPSSVAGLTARAGLDATMGPGFDGQRVTLSEGAVETARRLLS